LTRKNSYDFIRLAAASLVVFSHSFALSGNDALMIGNISIGKLGVWIFFILSGYFIAISWDQYPRFNVFMAKRALRIFPGLIVNILLTIVVLGIFFNTDGVHDYFSRQSTYTFLNNILLYPQVNVLSEVFNDNVYRGVINGSLWTLRYEFTMYIFIALIGVFSIYKKVRPITIWGTLFILEILIIIVGEEYFKTNIFFLQFDRIILLSLLFFSGVLFYKYVEKISLSYSWGLAAIVLFVILATIAPVLSPILASVFLAYGLISLGSSSKLSSVSKIGDLSYGLYIYSFPVQQCVSALTHTTNPFKMFIASYGISLVLALLSWHFVESKALRLKKRIKVERYPITQVDHAW
jgi:peptidoglycan/LPS O-acetylase OafA/YrhL